MPAPSLASIEIDGMEISVLWRPSRRATRLRLTIDARRGLRLVVPAGVSQAEAARFVEEQRGWVRRHLPCLREADRLRREAARPPDRLVVLGQPIAVQVQEGSASCRVDRTAEGIRACVRRAADVRPLLQGWLRRKAAYVIPPGVHDLAQRHDLSHFRRISVRDQSSRWGSCSRSGALSFNWRLVLVPPPVMEYVILHELTHLQHPHHRREFWKTLTRVCPLSQRHRGWLLSEGEKLMTFWPPGTGRCGVG